LSRLRSAEVRLGRVSQAAVASATVWSPGAWYGPLFSNRRHDVATTIERAAKAQAVEGPKVKANGGLVLVRARLEGISPLLMNAMSQEQLLNIRDKVKSARNAAKPTPREEADSKVHRMPNGEPHIPTSMLMACLIGAGQFVRLDGKRQISTAKSTVLPGLVTIEDRWLPLTPVTWEVDIAQGRNPNGGEAVCIIRPRFDEWGFDVTLSVDQSQIAIATIRELVDIAGKRVGLGDFRPKCKGTFGRFAVTRWEIE